MRSIVGKRSLCAFKNQFAKSISSVVPKSDVQVKDFQIKNEPILGYLPGSEERKEVEASLSKYANVTTECPIIIGGKEYRTDNVQYQVMPHDHSKKVAKFYYATPELINKAIETSLEAKKEWGRIPIQDRIDLFMKVSDQMSKEYRGDLNATTMLGQSKTIIQAEIDSACEIIDFFRFNCFFSKELLNYQPISEDPSTTLNMMRYRSLDGFIASVSPFNFTAIAGNLAYTPSIMGNGTVWKPSDTAILSNHLIYEIFKKAGFPDGLVNFVPSDGLTFGKTITASPNLAAVNFTGSVPTFQWLWKAVGENISNYTGFPKLVGECGGKNYHFVHPSAEVETVVKSTIRSAFEYQGQKCSACSRVYAPKSLWPKIKEGLIETQKSLKVGDVQEFDTFMSAVIDRKSFDRNKSYIDHAKSGPNTQIIAGGTYDDSKGFFIQPTIVETTDINDKIFKEEIFGPIVSVFVYDDKDAAKYVQEIGTHTPYALTGAIYCQEEDFAQEAARILRHTAGNFYVNDKSTGSVVGQQPFGGDRLSGTNDKAGGPHYMLKWASAQSIKQTFVPLHDVEYPYMKS
ncbi:delta-1-pyrroline-5-carboxylate dehydrogenase, mitochondrial [Lepeophtheirus salmonis]|nr:delta-1-pyrroline-5-carboxylate dehydrogenase, mitochondrial-like [Lepeophtheirus salmonis]